MSEIRDKVKDRMAEELKVLFGDIADKNEYLAIVNVLFSKVSELATVDREAELPSPGIDLDKRLVTLSGTYGAYRMAQQDMTEADWVKEVK